MEKKQLWRTPMKILLVADQFDRGNNGTTISAQRLAKTLRSHGHLVRAVSTGEEAPDKYVVPKIQVPVFEHLIESQGMMLGHGEPAVLREAISWADVVHFMMPFPLSIRGEKIAGELGIPRTAAFHVQPENITYSIGMGKWEWVNRGIYRGFNHAFYHKFRHIHCPSQFIADELTAHGYTACLHVISNGVESDWVYKKSPKPPELAGKQVILMTGRYSGEKRQDVLIEAVRRSRHSHEIQLVLAGQGPKRGEYERLGQTLPHPPILRFFEKPALQKLIAMSDLYVHAADAEIEAISCMEAFSAGLVPVIANSVHSATRQFALDDRSLFIPGNPADLAEKIDYWLDHPKERKEMELRYSDYGRQYDLDSCVRQLEEMFRQAIEENAS